MKRHSRVMGDDRTVCRAAGSYTSSVQLTREAPKEPDESESASPEASDPPAGYTGAGIQVGEAEERYSSSRHAVGRAESDSLQHNFTSPQSSSEKPRDSASRGFSGRSPLSTAGTGV